MKTSIYNQVFAWNSVNVNHNRQLNALMRKDYIITSAHSPFVVPIQFLS